MIRVAVAGMPMTGVVVIVVIMTKRLPVLEAFMTVRQD